MGSENLPLRNIGIYHNLPTFDPSIKGLSAIITGANGISGFYTMRALLDSPERWSKIYALSRRPPPESMMNLLTPEQRSRVEHVACDFLKPASEIAEALRSARVQASHVFFYSYLQPPPPEGQPIWSNADELVKVNTALLSNFINALPEANITPERFLLQTGAKNYGVHIGRTRTPAVESDPQPTHLEPNFYYPQEKILFDYCQKSQTQWNVIRPAWIIGATTNAQMNALHPYAVYASVQAHKNQPLSFPSDFEAWQNECFHSTARLTGYLSEWATLEHKCANQAFNSIDTSPFSFDRFYSELARWFDVNAGINTPTGSDEENAKIASIPGKSGKDTPLGYGPAKVYKSAFSLVQWAKQDENKSAWREIMDSSTKAASRDSNKTITHNPFDDPEAHFSCGDAAFARSVLCMNKARRLGWTGFVDTMEGVFEMYREMASIGMLPEMKVTEARPLI